MNNNHSEMSELIEIYVLGGLTPPEFAKLEEHLKECPACSAYVSELREITDVLPLVSESITPPAGMKQRILDQVLQSSQQEEIEKLHGNDIAEGELIGAADSHNESSSNTSTPARWRWISVGLAAAVAVLLVYNIQLTQKVDSLEDTAWQIAAAELQVLEAQRKAAELESKLAAASKPVQGLQLGEAVRLDPAAQDIVASGLATIVIDDQGTHLVVQAEKLPELQNNEAYQVWLIKGEEKHNAGTFLARDGTGALYYTFEPGGYETVAITLEPDAYGDQPRGKLILAAPIQG